MVNCERCGTENLVGSQYCDECGAVIGPTSVAEAVMPAEVAEHVSSTGDLVARSVPAQLPVPEIEVLRQESERPFSQHTQAIDFISPAAVQPKPVQKRSPGVVANMDGAHAKLVIERGRSAGKQFPLCGEEMQIGRWDADGGIFPDVDLDADDPEAKVSRRHARIVRRNGQYLIEDLGSTNGTFINRGRRLLPGDRQPLRDGDEIIVGKTFIRFHLIN
jgi:FHA domain